MLSGRLQLLELHVKAVSVNVFHYDIPRISDGDNGDGNTARVTLRHKLLYTIVYNQNVVQSEPSQLFPTVLLLTCTAHLMFRFRFNTELNWVVDLVTLFVFHHPTTCFDYH